MTRTAVIRRECALADCTNKVRTSLAKYCSPQCHYADKANRRPRRAMVKFVCEGCGQTFERQKGKARGRFCSPQCQPGPRALVARVAEPVAIVKPAVHPRRLWDAGDIYCVVCGRRAQRHHIITARHVIDAGGHVWDVRNRLGVCTAHHYAHHNRTAPLPLVKLPDSVFEFAVEVLGHGPAYNALRRDYTGEDPRLDAILAFTEDAA